jgi:hypothetical protein
MSPLWYWRYIPCAGVKLEFERFDLYQIDGRTIVHLTRRDPQREMKYIPEAYTIRSSSTFANIERIDFELALASIDGDTTFNLDYAHVFSFLLMIRTGGWISAPVILTHSTLQNAMQAPTSFHCIPYSSTCLLVAWSGLEALFGVDQEISFRLCLYITNFLKSGDDRYSEFEKLRRSYNDRSRVAHGAATKARALRDYAMYTRDILRACLAKCIETNAFPNPKQLIF